MKTNRIMWPLAAAVLTLFSGVASATAQNIEFTTAKSLDAIESRLISFENRLARLEMGGGGGCGCTAVSTCNACSSCCDTACPTAGLVGTAEILFLRAYATDGGAVGNEDTHVAGRFMVGYQFEGGMGGRVRYFELHADTTPGDIFDLYTFDLEAFDRFELGENWTAVFSGGVRYAHFGQNFPNTFQFTPADFYGFGPVVGAELNRWIYDDVSMFISARQAIIGGEDKDPFGNDDEYEIMSISELQIGAEYTRDLRSGARFFARAAFEGQWWGGMVNDDSEDFGLIGGTLAIGLAR